MKLRNFKQLGTAAILTAVLALNSCQKEEVIAPKKNTATPVDITAISFDKVDQVHNDVLRLLDAVTSGSFKTESILSCATVTRDESSLPYHATIDYGVGGCTDENGDFRSGSIEIYYNSLSATDFRNTENGHIDVTFHNFNKGTATYDGNVILHNAGQTDVVIHNNKFEIDINMNMTDNITSDVAYLNGNQDFEYTRGYETQDRQDDAVEASGSISGTYNGEAFTVAITPAKPLLKYRSDACNAYYVKGEMVYTYASRPTETVDYGTGTCDNLAMKTVGSNPPEEITLD